MNYLVTLYQLMLGSIHIRDKMVKYDEYILNYHYKNFAYYWSEKTLSNAEKLFLLL